MDSSLQSAHPAIKDSKDSALIEELAAEESVGEHHIHLPNPSLWPLVVSVGIFLTIAGLLFIPDNPWLAIVGGIIVLIGILGFGLEDPMAPKKDDLISVPLRPGSKYVLGQEVIDKAGQWVGTVQARFDGYILVQSGGLFGKAFYVPQSLISNDVKDGIVRLTVNENELSARELDAIPDDLYEESPEYGEPRVQGVPLFARGPLSPAETGHYNYGPYFPGMNTDASGSYHRDEVRPTPQNFVAERRRYASTSKMLPPRSINPD
jgi:hypothetical protein